MSRSAVRGMQVLWLVAFVVVGAFLWYRGDAALGAGLVALGLVWEAIGFVVGFTRSFLAAFREEARAG